ncbi:MAG: hypothetical protein NTU80_04120 [Verrucomicrobia bacterium]|nr:hypothetical protein [Verrucomicrobiota bacterium]
MRLRPLFLTLAILAPVAAGVWWLQRPQAQPATLDPRVGRRVADPATLASAARIELKADNRTLGFTRSTEGRWTLEGTPALPADLSRLGRLSSDLLTPKIERFVTANPSRLASLELDQTRISYFDAGGKPLLALDLGKNADQPQPRRIARILARHRPGRRPQIRRHRLPHPPVSRYARSPHLLPPRRRQTLDQPGHPQPQPRRIARILARHRPGRRPQIRRHRLPHPPVSRYARSPHLLPPRRRPPPPPPRPPPRPRKPKPPRRPRRPPRLVPFMSSSPTRNPTPSWSPPPAPTPSRSPNGFSTVCPVNRPTPSSPSPPLRRRPPPPSR